MWCWVVSAFLAVVLLAGCGKEPGLPASVPTRALTASSTPTTRGQTVSTDFPPPDSPTLAPITTPAPSVTRTAALSMTAETNSLVNTADGFQFSSDRYGFSITLPPDIDLLAYDPPGNGLFSAFLPQLHLPDGGDLVTWFGLGVEDQTDNCHPQLTDPAVTAVKTEHANLGGDPFTILVTPDLDENYTQEIEYMTYGTDFCVHIYARLTTYYFDQGEAVPQDMIPIMQDELDRIVTTFQWLEP